MSGVACSPASGGGGGARRAPEASADASRLHRAVPHREWAPSGGGVRRFLADLAGYGFVSAVALACDWGLLVAFTRLGLHYLLAATISFSFGIVIAYALSIRFVFQDRRAKTTRSELAGFVAVGVAGLLLTQGLLVLFVSGLGIGVALAKIPTAGCVFLFNFLARRELVFAGSGAR